MSGWMMLPASGKVGLLLLLEPWVAQAERSLHRMEAC